MARNLDITLIRTFVAVADQGSMTAAAGRLHLTQGAISQHIRRLEELVGAPLFDRDRPRLRLSEAGERLLGKARALLEANDELLLEMRAPEGEKLRLGLPYDLVAPVFMPVLKAYAQARPEVEVLITCATSPNLHEGFASGALDLAVVEEPHAQARGECLRAEALVWVGAPGGEAHLRRPLPLSMVDRSCAFRPLVTEALRSHDLPWRALYENGDFETNVATIQADLAVAAWLSSVVPGELRALGDDTGLPALPRFQISLFESPGASEAAREMARCIRASFTSGNPGSA